MAGRLNGRVAVVTGASSGIGEATARALAKEGAKVALVARRKERLDSLAEQIRESGGIALPLVADVSSYESASSAITRAREEFGGLHILVNNAGVMLLGPINGAEISDWQRMIDINMLGLMYCTHAVLPFMIEQKSGHVVNISSVSGRVVRSGTAVYNATKFAVGAFSEALRQEVYEANVRVTTIEPGAVATELADHITNKDVREKLKSWVGQMTPLSAEDIADSILYAVTQSQHVNVNEILLRPTEQLI